MKINFNKINEYCKHCMQALVTDWIPGGKFQGVQYIVRNPRRNDKRAGSFKINISTGAWKDYACNGVGGKDPISLYAYLFTNDEQYVAAKEINDRLRIMDKEIPKMKKKPKYTSEIIVPVPKEVPEKPIYYKDKKIKKYYPYYNANSELLGYTCRIESDGNKIVLPITYRVDENGKKGWKFKSFDKPRPLYGLHLLEKNRDAQVVIVEGEKCADFGNSIFDHTNILFVSWVGGSSAVMQIDWSPLMGRKIVFWPDADTQRNKITGDLLKFEDQPGASCMIKIYNIIKDTIGNARLLRPPSDKVNGWDIADCIGWDSNKILQFIQSNVEKFETKKERKIIKSNHFQCLGYNTICGNTMYYYLPHGTNRVTSLTATGHGKMGLLQLAPVQYYEREFPSKSGADFFAAANTLMRNNEAFGIYDPARIRGRGAWYDDGRTVLHLGNQLIVDGKKHKISELDTKYIYEAERPTENKSYDFSSVLGVNESRKLIKICDMISWENEINSKLFAGWLAIAPICGAIDWRPHIWLSGESGTGKTWIIENIVHPILGKGVLFASSNSTESGVRQFLKNDANPVIFDEMETEDKYSFMRVQKIIELARLSSSNKSANIIKGSAGGNAMLYMIRSCFLFSSINPKIIQQADESRIKILKLIKRPSFVNNHLFKKLSDLVFSTLTDDYCMKLRSRIINMIPTIRENVKIFTKVMEKELQSKRLGDQYGAMMAGAFSLVSNDVVNHENAEKYAKRNKWFSDMDEKMQPDQEKLINVLLQKLIRVDRTGTNEPIGKLLRIAARKLNTFYEPGFNEAHTKKAKEALDIIRKYGITIINNSDIREIAIACNYDILKELLKNTPWNNGYDIVLARMEGANKRRCVFSHGRRQYAISIPFDNIFDIPDEEYFLESDNEVEGF